MKTANDIERSFLFQSPIGLILCLFEGEFLIGVTFDKKNEIHRETGLFSSKATPPLSLKERVRMEYPLFLYELSEYFSGTLKVFNQPIKIKNGTPFDHRVWSALREIPYGSTTTYKELAKRVGSHQAYRAVGSSLRRNPLPIILPCHRVISTKGSLCGYSSGLEIKRWLLEHEGVLLSQRCLED